MKNWKEKHLFYWSFAQAAHVNDADSVIRRFLRNIIWTKILWQKPVHVPVGKGRKMADGMANLRAIKKELSAHFGG
ncbi:MAG: hypothetical protein AB7E52_06645 [Bdellovibrionales bacterium]